MSSKHMVSRRGYEYLCRELDAELKGTQTAIDSILGENQSRLAEELEVARARLSAARRSAIEQAMHDGWITAGTASKMIEEAEAPPGGEADVSAKDAGSGP